MSIFTLTEDEKNTPIGVQKELWKIKRSYWPIAFASLILYGAIALLAAFAIINLGAVIMAGAALALNSAYGLTLSELAAMSVIGIGAMFNFKNAKDTGIIDRKGYAARVVLLAIVNVTLGVASAFFPPIAIAVIIGATLIAIAFMVKKNNEYFAADYERRSQEVRRELLDFDGASQNPPSNSQTKTPTSRLGGLTIAELGKAKSNAASSGQSKGPKFSANYLKNGGDGRGNYLPVSASDTDVPRSIGPTSNPYAGVSLSVNFSRGPV